MLNYRKMKALITLLRPELPFAAGISVIIGEIITLGHFPPLSELLLGFSWGFFLSAPAIILNDLFDVDVDRVNAPHRPLPSGLISTSTVIVFTGVTTLIGLLTSFFIGSSAVLLYIIFWVIGFLYNWKLKEQGFFGNLLVSSSVAVTIILGGIVAGDPWNKGVAIFSLMFFLFNLGEEVAADAMDMEGDKKRNIKSVAILIGRKNALYISFSLFMVEIGLSYLPVILGIFGISYLIIISLTNITLLYFAIKLITSKATDKGRIYIRRLYLSALAGFLLIIISIIL
ncbi:MAG: UbiA family prenyltransferase [Bacillota bacterium]